MQVHLPMPPVRHNGMRALQALAANFCSLGTQESPLLSRSETGKARPTSMLTGGLYSIHWLVRSLP
jgi:hypothetical protein